MSFLLELTRGQARQRQIAFRRGQPRPTVSIGRQAAWSIVAEDIEDVHAFVSFDGHALMVRSADDSNPVWLDGRAVPCAWTPARVSSVLGMGSARITIVAVKDPADVGHGRDEDEDDEDPPSTDRSDEVTGQFDLPGHGPNQVPGLAYPNPNASLPGKLPPPRPPVRGALPPVAGPPRPARPPSAPPPTPPAPPTPPPPRPNVQMAIDDESTRMLDPRLPIAKTQPLPPSFTPPPTPMMQEGPASDDDEATRTVDVGRIQAEHGFTAHAPGYPDMGAGARPRLERPDIGPPPSSNEATMMLEQARTLPKPPVILVRPPSVPPPPPPSIEEAGPSSATQMKPLTAPVIRPPLPDRAPASWGEATQLGELQRPKVDPLAATGEGISLPRFVPPPGLPPLDIATAAGPLRQPRSAGVDSGAASPDASNASATGKKQPPRWVGPAGAGVIILAYLVYLYFHVQQANAVIDQASVPIVTTTTATPVTSAVVISPTDDQPAALPRVANAAPTADPIVAPGSKNMRVVDAGMSDASTTVERAAVDALAQNNKARAEFFYEQLANAAPTNRAYVEAVRILRMDLGDSGPNP